MSTLTEHFKVCGCHDSWDQCPCAEGGHPLDRECGCCPQGNGLCGPLPTWHARVAAAVAAERERLREALATCACGCDVGNHWTVCSTYDCPCGRDRVRAEATTRAAALLAAEREGGEE